MDAAHIKSDIPVQTSINVDFPLHIDQNINVTLTEATSIRGALVSLNTGGLNINNAPANIVLPVGAVLPIHLEMIVQVSQRVDVSMVVPVDIPLSQTELHEPFTNLRDKVISPYLITLWGGPYYWEEVPACKVLRPLCDWWFR